MRRKLTTFLCALGSCGLLLAQTPVITAIQDAGAYTDTVPQGGVFVVKGTNLVSVPGAFTAPLTNGNYPSQFNGVSIAFNPASGSGPSFTALIVNTYDVGGVTQVGALLPANVPAGQWKVVLTNNTVASAPFTTQVVVRKFGLLTVPGSGAGRAVVENNTSTGVSINRYSTGTLTYLGQNYPFAPAVPGEVETTFGTGLNATGGSVPNVMVIVGNLQVTPSYAGSQGQYPGLDQVNFQLPANVQTGCNVPLAVLVDGKMSNSTTIAIATASSPSACRSPLVSTQVLTALDNGGTTGYGEFVLGSYRTGISPTDPRTELATGGFALITADNLNDFGQFYAPLGTCQVFQRVGVETSLLLPAVTYLDAGTVTLTGPNLARSFIEDRQNVYLADLGTNNTALINPGSYQIAGAGGKDVGKFSGASTTVNAPITLNAALPTTVNRSQNLTISWTGGGSDNVQVIGLSGAATTNTLPIVYQANLFICTTAADSGSFTVPSYVLQALPASQSAPSPGFPGIAYLAVFSTTSITANPPFTFPLTNGNQGSGVFLGVIGTRTNTVYQ